MNDLNKHNASHPINTPTNVPQVQTDQVHTDTDDALQVLIVGGSEEQQADIAAALADAADDDENQVSPEIHCVSEVELISDQIDCNPIDVLLIDARLLQHVEKMNATAEVATIVFTATSSFNQAVAAMRIGAVDVVNTARDIDVLPERVAAAAVRSRTLREQARRMVGLKRMCRELNSARMEASRQVDTLCSELASAYENVADQISEAKMVAECKTLLSQELDVEDLLRTMLEFLLTRTGPTNAAVFLPDEYGYFNLGAYVNYDCPRDSIATLLSHVAAVICPQMADETDLVAFDDAGEFASFIGMDASFLAESEVIAMSCQHDDECMAILVLFRNQKDPFNDEIAGMLDTLRKLFATQLARVVRIHHRAQASWPSESFDDEFDYDDFGFGGVAA